MVAVAVPGARPGAHGAIGRDRVRQPVTHPSRPTSAACFRRRRVAVSSLFLGMLLAGRVALGLLGSGPLSASQPASPVLVSERVHIVQPGDTLWSIARSLQPEGDVRRVVHQLVSQRDGAALRVGERIALP